jgi:hypothetical protein
VYVLDGSKDWLEAELFSSSISKQLEATDLDLVSSNMPPGGTYQLRVTNEALETHYINKFSLLAVNHPVGTKVFPSPDGGFVTVGKLVPPQNVVNRAGQDISALIRAPDTLFYRSGGREVLKLAQGPYNDWLDVTLNVPEAAKKVRMVLRVRNTLLSTILLYDVVLASQGIQALEWTEKMNTDAQYASQFREIYNAFSGIAVKVLCNGEWTQQTSIRDVGPITWKYVAAEIPVDRPGALSLRLEFVPDNYAIDYVAFDTVGALERAITVDQVRPIMVRDNLGVARNDILSLINEDDDSYLVTNPGEAYRFSYNLSPKENSRTTLFISSGGYYTEWIRSSWLRNQSAAYPFNLFDLGGTLSQLAYSWQENRDMIEREFYDARIPVKEVP